MNCNNIEHMISEYLDNELPKEKEGLFFTHLSTCSNCREEFRLQNLIQHEVNIYQKEVSTLLDERVFSTIQEKNKSFTKRFIHRQTPAYINYALGILIVVITIISFFQLGVLKNELDSFKDRYETALERIHYQKQQINLMMNNMPAVQISSNPASM